MNYTINEIPDEAVELSGNEMIPIWQGETKKVSVATLAGYVQDADSYSTTETLTGGKWIDGKPIYRKVWNIPSFTDNMSFSGGLSNVETVIKMYGTSYFVAESLCSQFPRNSAGNYFDVVYQVSTDTIIFANYSGYNGSKVLLIMEYTKTTD